MSTKRHQPTQAERDRLESELTFLRAACPEYATWDMVYESGYWALKHYDPAVQRHVILGDSVAQALGSLTQLYRGV